MLLLLIMGHEYIWWTALGEDKWRGKKSGRGGGKKRTPKGEKDGIHYVYIHMKTA
jgi:hypothetical protein